ncbi:MAG: TIGR04282 family arsenosugar biosynthesis glycosyltransferase [Pirellulales bacterium]|nr:TIGR04282 family arsenosugar biosynthesis glycosyltransferase [Pirellulales bacterium]
MTEGSRSKESTQFGILAKHWSPGRVKTRLADFCGEQRSAQLHRAFLESTLCRFSSVADRHVLSFTPEQTRADFDKISGGRWKLLAQVSGDLGERIANYFQEAFASGSERVVLVGADAPSLPIASVAAAFRALEHHDLAFVPSEDGGYCLIGATRPVEPLTTNIRWGSDLVWEQTREKISTLNWSAKILPSWYDIDHEKDLSRLMNELASIRNDSKDGQDAEDANLNWLYGQIHEICKGLFIGHPQD